MERLGDTVRHALHGAGVPDTGALAELASAWPDAVGDAIARAAWPLRLARDGTLHVATISATWAFELGLLEPEIRSKLLAAAPGTGVEALRFAVGPVPAQAAPLAADRPIAPPEADDGSRRRAEELAAVISDERLRETVARAAAASLARAAADRHF